MADTERYDIVIGEDEWGLEGAVESDEHEDACDRMEWYLTEHQGDSLSFVVRPPKYREITGTYRLMPDGRSILLGGSIPEPDDVRELRLAAHEHAISTWR